MLTIQTALAQTFRVKGTVVSAEDNEPLIGATILQEGTTNGVVTDVDGNYTIEVKGASKATLVFSYVGMETQKHLVNAQTNTLNMTLSTNAKVMDVILRSYVFFLGKYLVVIENNRNFAPDMTIIAIL